MYCSGTRISEAIWKNAGVPAQAKTIEEHAEIADSKVGSFTPFQLDLNGPGGAAAGLSCTPTAIVKVRTVHLISF